MFNNENIVPFEKKIRLSSPAMHGGELKWVTDAFEKNWITTAGDNIDEIERMTAEEQDKIIDIIRKCFE